MNKCSGIYRIELGNGHFYIGSAIDIDKRKRDHRNDLKRGAHCNKRVQHCWNKYGVFEFTVLEECVKDGLIVREQFYLDQHCDNPKNVNLVSTAGSNLGHKHSVETRAKMSAAKKGVPKSAETRANMSVAKQNVSDETRAKISAAAKNRLPISDETRAKMSAARKGVPLSAETRAKMSKPKSAEHRAKISAARKGVPLSAETRAKMSAAKKGKPLSAEHRAKLSATRRRNRCER